MELWKNRGLGWKDNEMKLRFSSVRDNVYKVFGTNKILRLFSPSFRNVPFTGLEWSFKMKDEGYGCDGYKLERGEEDCGGNIESYESSEEDEVEMIKISN